MATIEKVSRVKQHTVYKTQDGKRVPGVTTILGVIDKPALKYWSNKIGLQGIEMGKYVDALADIGTLAHEMIVADLIGEKVDLNAWSPEQVDMASNAAIKFLNWAEQYEIEVLETEIPMVSEEYRFGGTIDILARVNGRLEIIDIKTAKGLYSEHFYQAAGGYVLLAREHGYDVKAARIVRVGRSDEEGDVESRFVSGSGIDRNVDVFLSALNLYKTIKVAKRAE